VCAGDDPALGGLPKDLGEADHGHRAGSDNVGEDLTWADGRELVDVADDQQRGIVRGRLHQRLHQHDVDHRGLVDDLQSRERVFGLPVNFQAEPLKRRFALSSNNVWRGFFGALP